MKTIDVHDVQTQISSILIKIDREHETFLICRHGEPIADLIPHHAPEQGVENRSESASLERERVLQKLQP